MSETDFSFIANSKDTTNEMLENLNVKSLKDLFRDIPGHLILKSKPSDDFPDSHAELETQRRLVNLSRKNTDSTVADIFIGSGIYDHYIPASVSEITNRAEFKTAYTPYAPELSQGLLTTLYEYQSMICELTGLEIANTSMYDWSTALAEAALMCMRIKNNIKNPVFLVSEAIHRDRLETLRTFARPLGLTISLFSYNDSGQVDIEQLEKLISENTIGVYIENPNLFGLLEIELNSIIELSHNNDLLLVMGVDPISLGVIESPGSFGADICVGEAHHLGNAPNYGGPSLGILTSKNTKLNIRNMPGRIIGYTRTKDDSRDAYIMTLQTREQHIRREKATSNICTNESLFSVAAAAYLSIMGPKGLETIGKDLIGKINYVVDNINKMDISIKVPYRGPFFKETLISIPKGKYNSLKNYLMKQNILIGPNIVETHELPFDFDGFIFSVSEKHTKDQLDNFIHYLHKFSDPGN